MAGGYNSPYGNIRSESLLANAGWDYGIDPSQYLPNMLSDEKLYGQDFSYLQQLLKGEISNPEMNPALRAAEATANRDVSKFGDTARLKANQALASSGFRGSGANIMSDIFGQQADARQGIASDFGLMGMQARQKNIDNLLGLNQFQAGQNVGQEQFRTGAFQNLLQSFMRRQGQKEGADLQRENQPGFWDFAGNLASGAAGVGTAAILMSDKKLKKNIKKVGDTKSGLPIHEFEYKDLPGTKIKGHLAQSVEKKFPDAVVRMLDYSKLPKDAKFELVN